jgi:hypothetical protein
MTRGEISMLLLMAGSSLVWGADTKENLNQARSEYRQAVSAHGEKSPEAREARQNLRQTRRTFHAERRERLHNRQHGR